MDNNLESLLEKYGATDDEQLSRALDEILSDPDKLKTVMFLILEMISNVSKSYFFKQSK